MEGTEFCDSRAEVIMLSIQMTWKMGFLERLEPLPTLNASLILFEEYLKSSPSVGQSTVAQASCRYNFWKHVGGLIYLCRILRLKCEAYIFVNWRKLECSWNFTHTFRLILEFKTAVKIPLVLMEFPGWCVSPSTFFTSQALPTTRPPSRLRRYLWWHKSLLKTVRWLIPRVYGFRLDRCFFTIVHPPTLRRFLKFWSGSLKIHILPNRWWGGCLSYLSGFFFFLLKV